jgi:hypothetical protein
MHHSFFCIIASMSLHSFVGACDRSNARHYPACDNMPCTESIRADLAPPPILFNASPAAGQMVVQTTEGLGYDPSRVFHSLYLPPDWVPNSSVKYPLIVELSGNTVLPSDTNSTSHGWAIGQGKAFIWVILPYLSGNDNTSLTCNQREYWGCAPESCHGTPYNKIKQLCQPPHPHFNVVPTVNYTIATVNMLLERYNGDASKVLLTGHSRGSLATNYIGLHDDRIAELWTAFAPIAHYDGAKKTSTFPPYPNSTSKDAEIRLQRVGPRPVFIAGECAEATVITMKYLNATGYDLANFTVRGLGFIDHNSHWGLRPDPLDTRAVLREWVGRVLAVEMPPTAPPTPAPPTPPPVPTPPTPSSPTPHPPTPIACDTRNTSVSAIVVGGAGTAAVNGRYARTNSTSDGLPIFSLDQEHQLYSKRHTWRLAYFQNYLYYVSSDGHLAGPPVPNQDEWIPTGKGEGAAPSSIVCEYSAGVPPMHRPLPSSGRK